MSGFAPLPNFQPPFLAGYIPAPRRSIGEEVLGSALGAAATKGVGSLMDKYLVSEEDKLRMELIQNQIENEKVNRQLGINRSMLDWANTGQQWNNNASNNQLTNAQTERLKQETDAFVSNNEQTAVNALIDKFTGSGIPQEVFSGATTIEEVNQAAKQHGNNIAQDLSTEDSGGGWSELGKSGGEGIVTGAKETAKTMGNFLEENRENPAMQNFTGLGPTGTIPVDAGKDSKVARWIEWLRSKDLTYYPFGE